MVTSFEEQAEIFDPLSHLPKGALENPYPLLTRMRERSAVQWSQKGNQWLVLRYDEALTILRSNQFGKRLDKWTHPSFVMRQAMKIFRRGGLHSILLQDPPDHTRVRSLVNSAFTPRVVHELESHISAICENLLDNVSNEKSFDVIADLAFPLPVTVISELLGVPSEDRGRFRQWSTQITRGLDVSSSPIRLVNSFLAMEELRFYLAKVIGNKRKNPGKDLLSLLIAAQSEDNQRLSEEELLSNAILILIAGHETTTNLIGNGVLNLLQHTEQLQLVRDDPATISGAVEESLRFDPAVQLIRRLVREPVEIGGVKMNANDGMTILLGACNRDPLVFANPDKFDILRENNRHITFGAGIHFCLGAELARTEARIAFGQLFKRFPHLRLSQTDPIVYKGPFGLRGIRRLVVTN